MAEQTATHVAIGALVKQLRKECKLNQTELAPILGLDQSALSRVESGKQVLTLAQFLTLAAGCKKPLRALHRAYFLGVR